MIEFANEIIFFAKARLIPENAGRDNATKVRRAHRRNFMQFGNMSVDETLIARRYEGIKMNNFTGRPFTRRNRGLVGFTRLGPLGSALRIPSIPSNVDRPSAFWARNRFIVWKQYVTQLRDVRSHPPDAQQREYLAKSRTNQLDENDGQAQTAAVLIPDQNNSQASSSS